MNFPPTSASRPHMGSISRYFSECRLASSCKERLHFFGTRWERANTYWNTYWSVNHLLSRPPLLCKAMGRAYA
eukprot:1037031-Pleurochrysis_carterae.AAC.4